MKSDGFSCRLLGTVVELPDVELEPVDVGVVIDAAIIVEVGIAVILYPFGSATHDQSIIRPGNLAPRRSCAPMPHIAARYATMSRSSRPLARLHMRDSDSRRRWSFC